MTSPESNLLESQLLNEYIVEFQQWLCKHFSRDDLKVAVFKTGLGLQLEDMVSVDTNDPILYINVIYYLHRREKLDKLLNQILVDWENCHIARKLLKI